MSKRFMLTILLTGVLLAGCSSGPPAPPLVYLVADGNLIDGFQSSYCWDAGTDGTICKDTMLPTFDETTSLPANSPIRLQFDTPLPDEVTLQISYKVMGDLIASESMPASELMEWSPGVAAGDYILVAHAKWKQGVVSYWFSISLE